MSYRLIDANALDIDNLDRAYDNNFELDFGRLYTADVIDMIANAPTINAIPIPKDATNGDVIKAMFPNAEISLILYMPSVDIFFGGILMMRATMNWWNAKYKGVSK